MEKKPSVLRVGDRPRDSQKEIVLYREDRDKDSRKKTGVVVESRCSKMLLYPERREKGQNAYLL